MLGKDHFYFDTIKTYIVAMSHIFDNIHVIRSDSSGAVVKDITVPLTYAGKTKLYYKLQQDQDRQISTILPRISFMFESMKRDPERSTLYSNIIKFTNDGVNEEYQYNPLSYNFNFSASIWTKYTEDIFQMTEQIASFFDPDFCITVNEIPVLGITKDISILLNDIDLQVDNEFAEDGDRVITADLDFTLKGYIYKPVSNGKLITHIIANMHDDNVGKKLETIEHKWNELTKEIDTTITEV